MTKLKYAVQISWSTADNCFLARVPELPGCMTDGETYEHAAKNAEEAMESYVEALRAEGKAVPVPLAEQDFSGKLNVRLGPELHRDVAVMAQAEGKSINDLLLEAALQVIKVHGGGVSAQVEYDGKPSRGKVRKVFLAKKSKKEKKRA